MVDNFWNDAGAQNGGRQCDSYCVTHEVHTHLNSAPSTSILRMSIQSILFCFINVSSV